MRIELTELLWLEEHAVSLPELSELSGLPAGTLAELIGAGAIEPLPAGATPEPRFGARALRAARRAQRLRVDFELDTQALLLALGLLERVDELEAQLLSLRARSPRGC